MGLTTNLTQARHTSNVVLITSIHRDELAAFIMPESTEMPLPHERDVPQLSCEETWEDVVISDHLNESQKDQVETLLQEYAGVFLGRPNLTDVITHRIDTGDSPPIRCTPYKVPQKLEEEVNNEITKMLKMGIIRPSTSPWAFPVVIVPKPDGTIRFCVVITENSEALRKWMLIQFLQWTE